tara:strand:+ start:242 stop:1213 length:972 start_codon:yes stop_codon:yes gene_type:complete
MKNKNILIVYNTCGIKRDNSEWYIKCMQSILDQDFDRDNYKILWSSCLNTPQCVKQVYSHFKNNISYCFHSEPHTVNITFNKAVREMIQHFGQFDYYMYIDSGVTFENQKDILRKIHDVCVSESPGMLTVQTDTDEALNALDESRFVYQAPTPQIVGEHFVVPVGKACNVHTHVYSNELYNTFNSKLAPDVFAAYCTESTFSFLTSGAKQRWIIMKDEQVVHKKGVDGASVCSAHHSAKYNNPWNNLLCDRNALDFINDKEAYEAGLGYEECNNIMNHHSEAYESDGSSKYPDKLTQMINKYFFLNQDELDYDKMITKFIAQK